MLSIYIIDKDPMILTMINKLYAHHDIHDHTCTLIVNKHIYRLIIKHIDRGQIIDKPPFNLVTTKAALLHKKLSHL